MLQRLIHKIQTLGVDHVTGYINKRDLVGFNTTFLWTNVLIFINIFISFLQHIPYVAYVNIAGNIVFILVLWLNAQGHFYVTRHIGIILAQMYVYVQSIVGGEALQFQYAYTIVATIIGIVFTQKKHLLVHLPICLLFFVAVVISYKYIDPIQYISPEERANFALNNGVIFMILVSVVALGFRNQSSFYIHEIEEKKNVIELKQKEIFDSITYVKHIQDAVLDNQKILTEHLGDDRFFLVYEPKDVVSGDFYWAAHVKVADASLDNEFEVRPQDELLYLAVCDSTGHGVPGAFMSLINIGYLKEAVNERKIYNPGKIFDFVRKKLIENINSEDHKDGFDGILICKNLASGKIYYAAANNRPVLINSTGLQVLEADKMPVGKGFKSNAFVTRTLSCDRGDFLYLYTDGFADQFGGEKGKKLMQKCLVQLLEEIAGLPAPQQQSKVAGFFKEWKGELDQVDDVCMIGLNIH